MPRGQNERAAAEPMRGVPASRERERMRTASADRTRTGRRRCRRDKASRQARARARARRAAAAVDQRHDAPSFDSRPSHKPSRTRRECAKARRPAAVTVKYRRRAAAALGQRVAHGRSETALLIRVARARCRGPARNHAGCAAVAERSRRSDWRRLVAEPQNDEQEVLLRARRGTASCDFNAGNIRAADRKLHRRKAAWTKGVDAGRLRAL